MLALLAMPVSMRILIAPLNWGLGHATRCIPLIERYLAEGWDVTLASDGDARVLLQAEFPFLECHELPGYGITYPRNGKVMVASMASQLPKLTARVNQEKRWLESFLETNPQDLILSDGRYGLHASAVRSVIMCHQTKIRSPKLEGMLNAVHARLLNRFDELWIPDDEDRTLSGELSGLELKIPIKFIGALSRLRKIESQAHRVPLLAVLSGPEPQRTMFEQLLMPVLKEFNGSMMIRGVMDDNTDRVVEGVHVVGHLLREDLESVISRAELTVCRSGYSSIMDLQAMDKRAILIPTPGQTEQEYLAARSSDSVLFSTLNQDEISTSLNEMIRVIQG